MKKIFNKKRIIVIKEVTQLTKNIFIKQQSTQIYNKQAINLALRRYASTQPTYLTQTLKLRISCTFVEKRLQRQRKGCENLEQRILIVLLHMLTATTNIQNSIFYKLYPIQTTNITKTKFRKKAIKQSKNYLKQYRTLIYTVKTVSEI